MGSFLFILELDKNMRVNYETILKKLLSMFMIHEIFKNMVYERYEW